MDRDMEVSRPMGFGQKCRTGIRCRQLAAEQRKARRGFIGWLTAVTAGGASIEMRGRMIPAKIRASKKRSRFSECRIWRLA
jgi:hypothetical protein